MVLFIFFSFNIHPLIFPVRGWTSVKFLDIYVRYRLARRIESECQTQQNRSQMELKRTCWWAKLSTFLLPPKLLCSLHAMHTKVEADSLFLPLTTGHCSSKTPASTKVLTDNISTNLLPFSCSQWWLWIVMAHLPVFFCNCKSRRKTCFDMHHFSTGRSTIAHRTTLWNEMD